MTDDQGIPDVRGRRRVTHMSLELVEHGVLISGRGTWKKGRGVYAAVVYTNVRVQGRKEPDRQKLGTEISVSLKL